MPVRRDLTLYQGNDETVTLAIVNDDTGTAKSLVGVTSVKMYVKATAQTADGSATVLATTTGEITITNAAGGLCSVAVPAATVATAGLFWYRVDVVAANIKTALFGPLHVIDL